MSADNGSHRESHSTRKNIHRRQVIKSLGVAGIFGLAGCSGDGGDGGDGDGGGGDSTTTMATTATADPNRTTIDYWTLFGGGDGATMKKMVDKFNKENKNIQLRRQRIPWDQYYNKLYTALTGGNAPDLAICHLSRMRRFGPVFEPLSDTLDKSDYYAKSFKEATIKGEVRSAPLDILGAGTYYNKAVFEKAGLDPEQSMGSWSEFKEKINTVVSETDQIGYDPGADMHGNRVYYPWIHQMGHRVLKKENDKWKMGFHNDDGLKLLKTVKNMRANWNWFPKEGETAFDQFQKGGTAAINGGTWDYNNYKDSDLEWGFMKSPPAPSMGTESNTTWSNSHSIGVPRNKSRSKEKLKAAKKAAKVLTQDYGIMWGKSAGHIPNATKAREDPSLEKAPVWDKTMKTWMEMLKNEEFVYFPRTERNAEYHDAIYQPINAVRTGNMDPKAALDQIQKNINSVSR